VRPLRRAVRGLSHRKGTAMTEAENRKIVAETVAETLTRMGIPADDPIEVQKDMAHLRAWRESVATVKRQGIITAVGILTAGLLGILSLALKGPPPASLGSGSKPGPNAPCCRKVVVLFCVCLT